jgi:hypothetical protein
MRESMAMEIVLYLLSQPVRQGVRSDRSGDLQLGVDDNPLELQVKL